MSCKHAPPPDSDLLKTSKAIAQERVRLQGEGKRLVTVRAARACALGRLPPDLAPECD